MRIVRGNPTLEEVAALVVALALVPKITPAPAPNHGSVDAWRQVEPEVRDQHWRAWSAGWRDVTARNGRPVTRRERAWTRLVG